MRTEIVLIVATLGLLPVASRAQEPGGAVACPSIQNDQERLACYDRAMRGAPRAEPAPAPTPSPPPASAPAGPTPTASGSAASAPAAAAAVTGAAAATRAAETAAPSAPAATSSSTISTAPHNARNTTAPTPPQPGAPPTFDPSTGAPIGIVPVIVVSARSRPGLGTEFTTDTAGVWTQTEAKALTLPKTPFNAELQPGKFGSTFLVVPDRKLGIRVRPPSR